MYKQYVRNRTCQRQYDCMESISNMLVGVLVCWQEDVGLWSKPMSISSEYRGYLAHFVVPSLPPKQLP